MNIHDKANKYLMPNYGTMDIHIEKGQGSSANLTADNLQRNIDGVIDFASGIGVNSLGYCDADWVTAVCKQAQTVQHLSNYYYSTPTVEFAEKLCEITGYAKIFAANSGTEANECAIKLARKYSFDKYGAGRHKIITLKNSFHGRTLAALSATGQEELHNHFFPFLEGFEHIEPNDTVALAEKLGGGVCAVMLEYIQGEGGVIPLERDFVDMVYMLCAEKDILVIADEVQTGAGRTGKLLAGEWYQHKADITTMAKGLFGGLPGGVCLADAKCADVLSAGTHGSTFGGNPVVMAGGLAVLAKVAQPAFLAEVVEKGDYIKAALSGIPEVVTIDGCGLMLGITLKSKDVKEVMKSCLEKGLLVLKAKERLRLLPPLNINMPSLDKGLQILKEVLA